MYELLRQSVREAPVVSMGDYDYLVHPATDGIPRVEPALLEEIATGITGIADVASADLIVAPEAMGIHHATAVSLQSGVPFVVVRKRSYGLDGEVAIHQETGYAEGELYLNGVEPGHRVVFVDDVYSTGGTLEAVCSALLELGAELLDVVVVLRRGEPNPDLPFEVHSLLSIDVVDGEVVIEDDSG